VISELAEAVAAAGGAIRHVEDDERLAECVAAADLRFPLPPKPQPGP
jgi:hypothetical protein